jgi:hypothetical protein
MVGGANEICSPVFVASTNASAARATILPATQSELKGLLYSDVVGARKWLHFYGTVEINF